MGNEVLNIFSSNNFFEESNAFQENSENNFWGWHDHFLEEIICKNKYKLFYYKLGAKYFYVKQFFRKKQYFLRKLYYVHISPFFRERAGLTQKINITYFITN